MAFIKTLNRMGFMTDKPADPISQAFIDTCAPQKKVLEIGAAFGVATIPGLKRGAHVVANDVEQEHLRILESNVPDYTKNRLTLLPAQFPDETDFPEATFDAIAAIRILHFLPPDLFMKGLNKIYKWLKPGGQFFVVCETPFLSNLKTYQLTYKRRKLQGDLWPGYIQNIETYSNVSHQLPTAVNLLDKDGLHRSLKEACFSIYALSYLDRIDFPSFMRLDGRESVGAVAQKILTKD